MVVDPRSIRRASKAQQPNSGRVPIPGSFGGNGVGSQSTLGSQYAAWNAGQPGTSLPRPANVFTDATFGPLTPMDVYGINTPNDAGMPDPRRWEYPVSWNMPSGQPGLEGGFKLAPFPELRAICQLYSLAAACIDLRINEIRGLGWDIAPTQEAAKAMQGSPSLHADFQKRRAEALRFWKRPDSNYADMSSWLTALLYESFSVDAMALYLWPTKMKGKGLLGSNLAELTLIDGTSIKPMLDVYGGVPRPPNVAYQQYMYGVPRTDLMTIPDSDLMREQDDNDEALIAQYRSNQLLYLPYQPRIRSPYGLAPIERALVPAMAGLQRQRAQLEYYTEGTIPGAYITAGADMTMDQMRTFQSALNAIAGDPSNHMKVVVLPNGSVVQPMKPNALADQFDEIVAVQMCMAFGVMPMELGISPKVSTTQSPGASNQMAKASESINQRKALKPYLLFLKSTIFDNILQNVCGQADMEWKWEGLDEGVDEESQVNLLVGKINAGLLSIDEGRTELGAQPWGAPMTSEPVVMTPTGYVSLAHLDPATGHLIGDQPDAQAGVAPVSAAGPDDKPGDGAKPAAPEPKPKPPGFTQATSGTGATPGAAGAQAGAQASDQAVGGSGKPGGGQNSKAALAELDQLRRRLKQGRDISNWECKSIDQGVLTSLVYGLRMGEDPVELIDKARKGITDAEHLGRRTSALDPLKSDVASRLGKLANGLRTGRIAAPQFVTGGIEALQDGIARAYRHGSAHALSDRGHPGHLMHKAVKPSIGAPHHSTYGQLTDRLRTYWDGQARQDAEGNRSFLEGFARDLLGMTVSKGSVQGRLDSYGQQVMSAYEQAQGVTTIAVAAAEAIASGDDSSDDDSDPGEQVITWNTVDGGDCDMCEERDGEEYDIESLPCWPGDGFYGDFCAGGPNCQCYLTYGDKTAGNSIRSEGYADQRAGEAADQTERMQQVNDVRQMFVDSLPDAAAARAQERDDARQELATQMGQDQGFTAWPTDVAAQDVRDRVGVQR